MPVRVHEESATIAHLVLPPSGNLPKQTSNQRGPATKRAGHLGRRLGVAVAPRCLDDLRTANVVLGALRQFGLSVGSRARLAL